MVECCGEPGPVEETDGLKTRNPRTLRRSVCCTDIIVLILFILFWCLLLYIAVMSLVRGDSKRVIYGYDSSGNTCNQKNNNKIENLTRSGIDTYGKGNVFFMSMIYPKNSLQICIEKCPDKKLKTKQDVIDYYKDTGINLCQYGVKPSVNEKFEFKGPCPSLPVYKSVSLMSRCIPDLGGIANEALKKNISIGLKDVFSMNDFLQKSLNDLSLCWRELLTLLFIALVLAFLMVLAMRFFARIIVWLIVILSIVGSIAGTIVLWVFFGLHSKSDKREEFMIPLIGSTFQKRYTFLIFAIIASIFTVVLLLVLLVMRKRISLVVALFHEAGKCLADVPFLLVQPFWTFLFYVLITCYFIFIYACISTMGTPIARTKNGVDKVKFQKNSFEKQFWWIHLIGWIWTSEFILACQEFVISSAVSIWYFSEQKKSLASPILQSIKTLIFHHLGSIAFGSLIITSVKVIRYILMYIEQKCKGSDNACAQCCLKCCICCLWCLEKILKFLHQNAYTVIAIEGSNFCSSARKAFEIIASNALRVAAINSVGDFVLFLGKLSVMALSSLFAVLWLRTIPDLDYLVVPVVLVAIFSFLIAHCFLSVYEMVVDALLICFCEDCQRNDGTPGREYFMGSSLMHFVTESSNTLINLEKNHEGEGDAGSTLNN